MSLTAYINGATSKSILFQAFTTSTGAVKTDLVYNTSGLTCTYFSVNSLASSTVSLATLATPTTAYSSGGFVHIAGGVYRFDMPTLPTADYRAFIFSGVTDCTIVPYNGLVDLLGVDPRSSAAVAATIAAGAIATDAIDAASIKADAITEIVAGVFSRAFDATKMSGYTFEELIGLMACVAFAKASGMDTSTGVFRNIGDTANAISATVDANGNRTAVTRTLSSVR